MLGKFENSEDSQNSYENERSPFVVVIALAQRHGDDRDKIGQDGDQVEDVHDVSDEVPFAGTRDDPQDELDSEPSHTNGLDNEEGVLVVRLHLPDSITGSLIDARRSLERRQGFQAKVDDGYENTDDRDDSEDFSRLRAIGLLTKHPQVPLPLDPWHLFYCLHQKAFFLLVLSYNLVSDLVELEFLQKDVLGNLDRPAEAAPALVIV